MWKVGIGDLLKQITILHSVGAAAGLQYVHTPLRSSQTLSRPHRGSCSVDDIDFEAFLGVGANEQPVSTLPPLPTTVVRFNYRSTDDGGLEGAADRLLRTPGPCLLVLVFSYELLNSALALASLARHLGVPPRILRSPRCGLRLAYKYANARRSDRFSCGWRAGAIRVAVHVRRGDRAWVEVGGEGIGGGGSGGEEVDAGGTLYCMHQGLWTCRNLGRTCKLDGTLCLSDSASQGAIEGIRSRAPPAALLARCAELVRVALLSASGGGPTAARGAAATEVDILIVSDGYGEEYYRGFGDRVEAAFAAKQAADWARLRAVPSSRLVVGNDEPATRLAVDALLSAHVVVVGGGSHLPDVCQRYLTKPIKPNKGRAAWVNAWELRDEIGRGMLPEVVVCDLRAAAARAAAQVESGTGGTGAESHSEEEEEEDDKVGGSERHCSEVTVDAIGRSLEVCRLSAAPRLAVVSNLLTPSECAHIIRLGVESGGLHPSRVVRHAMPSPLQAPSPPLEITDGQSSSDGGEFGAEKKGERGENDDGGDDNESAFRTAGRTSSSCCIASATDEVVRLAIARAAYLVGLTPEHAEAAQLVHYTPGAEYRPHYDFFSPKGGRAFRIGTLVQGNRAVSVLVYLSSCAAGGHTSFPLLGRRFRPEPGRAVLWHNIDRDGKLDHLTLHAGEPVVEGEKWAMNIWLRQRPKLRVARKRAECTRARVELHASSMASSAPEDTGNGTGAGARGPDHASSTSVRLSVRVEAPQLPPKPKISLAECARCGDGAVGPIGLCLCKDRYVLSA